MERPNFLITRFTHGTAGKFLSIVLQTSDKVDHWSAIVQLQKKTELYKPTLLEYVTRSFPKDHKQYLQCEPMVPYNTDLYSGSYPRGRNVTIDEYIENAQHKNDLRMLGCIKKKLLSNIVYHNPILPKFCKGAKSVTITVTSPIEKHWLFETLWSKHFLETTDNIRYLPRDPEYCNFQSLPTVLRFNEKYLFDISEKDKLYNDYVVHNHTNSWYFDPNKFTEFNAEHQIDNIFISLEDILILDKFLSAIVHIFDKHDLGDPDLALIKNMHHIWLSRQIPYDLCSSIY